jgi:hypothetical protein
MFDFEAEVDRSISLLQKKPRACRCAAEPWSAWSDCVWKRVV